MLLLNTAAQNLIRKITFSLNTLRIIKILYYLAGEAGSGGERIKRSKITFSYGNI